MKLYKGDKVMQNVDKEQVADCLEAGWSRTVLEVPKKVVTKVKKIKPLKKKK